MLYASYLDTTRRLEDLDVVDMVVLAVLLDVVELLLEELDVVKAHCDHDHDPLGVLDVGLEDGQSRTDGTTSLSDVASFGERMDIRGNGVLVFHNGILLDIRRRKVMDNLSVLVLLRRKDPVFKHNRTLHRRPLIPVL